MLFLSPSTLFLFFMLVFEVCWGKLVRTRSYISRVRSKYVRKAKALDSKDNQDLFFCFGDSFSNSTVVYLLE